MRCFYVVTELPTTVQTVDEQRQFDHDDTSCWGGLLSVIGNSLIDAYIQLPTGKAIWDALEAHYGVSDAGSELYVMEQFHYYRMVENRLVVK